MQAFQFCWELQHQYFTCFFAVKEDRNINNFPLEFLFNISI